MELNDSLSLATPGQLHQQVEALCQFSLPGEFDQKHLPADLRTAQESYKKQMQYHLGQALSLYWEKGAEIQEGIQTWYQTTYYHHPSDLVGDRDWHNYYPGIVLSDKPYRQFVEAEPNTEAEQRFLTTQLITGAISKRKSDQILQKAQRLVCSRDPRDPLFFSEDLLMQCLANEGLDTDAKINRRLGRKPYTPVRKAERREVLHQVWTEREQELMQRYTFLQLNWEEDGLALPAVKTFTHLAFSKVVSSISGYAGKDFAMAIWEVLRQATEDEDEENYYLDPRDEDSWVGLRNLASAIREADVDGFHNAHQSGDPQGQIWMKTVGLPTLYGAKADWWEEHPNLFQKPSDDEVTELILPKSNRTAFEEMMLFRNGFANDVKDGGLKSMMIEKYGPALHEVFSNA